MTYAHTLTERCGVAVVLIAPLVLLTGFALHPWIGAGLPDQSAVAAAAADHTTRWGVAHLAIGAGSGLLAVAFLAAYLGLPALGRERRAGRAIPLIVLGSALYALLPGMEMAPLAAAEAGVDIEAVAEELVPWFIPIHLLGGLLFAVGVVTFRASIADSGILGTGPARIAAGALLVLAGSRLVPVTLVNFYVQGLAGIAALWPLALAMRNEASRGAAVSRPLAETTRPGESAM
jgi:hypothetical protein